MNLKQNNLQENCSLCKYWEFIENMEEVNEIRPIVGICRFNPPPYPETLNIDWCGKFEVNKELFDTLKDIL